MFDLNILKNIHQSKASDVEKAQAIYDMTQMATINSINKDNLFEIIKWLLPFGFSLPEDHTDVCICFADAEGLEFCPFCGKGAYLLKDKNTEGFYYVECQSCYARSDGSFGKTKAKDQWNKRESLKEEEND